MHESFECLTEGKQKVCEHMVLVIPLSYIYHKIKIYSFSLPQNEFKKRQYDKDYFQFGFTEAMHKGQLVPKCVICLENLSNDALRHLQCHL